MEIGLLSMQRVANYGSFWQAYCLRDMINKCDNCKVKFVDIIPGDIESRTEHKKRFSISKIRRVPYYFFQFKKRRIFTDFQSAVLGCTEVHNYQSDYDGIMIGSDEVFNFVQQSPWGFSPQLFGNIDNANVNTYAACFGNTTYEAILHFKKEEMIKKGLNNLRYISVRDENSMAIIEKLINKKPEIHFDPVIVGDLPSKLPSISDDKFILIYSYDFRMSDIEVIKQVRSFAKENRLKILSVGFYQDWVDKNVLPNPYQLLSYFQNAEFVVTDTFHGTIFSTRMHKRFTTIIRDTNRQKLGDLLNRLELTERRYISGQSLKDILLNDIDYKSYETLRHKERARTELFLKKCLTR